VKLLQGDNGPKMKTMRLLIEVSDNDVDCLLHEFIRKHETFEPLIQYQLPVSHSLIDRHPNRP
jgi:hypothetical protein